ncbi:D-serine ammonia-lyase [Castellaniella caeni]|uniref:D-serine ammonia-lyase n=1 Tax=Castellaniella caeni TaxID=266123 RepID=UPI00082EE55D|nr:D-serine ammonia-lyase [Castellaniella caeni]
MSETQTDRYPDLPEGVAQRQPLLWLNPGYGAGGHRAAGAPDPAVAEARFARCAALLEDVFPELQASVGRLESPLTAIPHFKDLIFPGESAGTWLLKRDDALPVAGSVKARGGFHEVLSLVEQIGTEAGFLQDDTDRRVLADPRVRAILGRHTLAVGSTGNLGLGIGLIGAGLGLRAVVHMSADAKEWKKQRLRKHGIDVVEHSGDYAAAVAAGRAIAQADPMMHFIDDEHSEALFLGYAAAAHELQVQLRAAGRPVDAEHPLFVYLPCGVGGAPGGILYGLKRLFGRHVHGFFVEPTASPCMLVQLACGVQHPVSVYDVGLDNRTEADGLAVGLASPLVAPLMKSLLSGVFTTDEPIFYGDAWRLEAAESIYVEPSAATGLRGPTWVLSSPMGQAYLRRHGLETVMSRASHVIWSTGGSLVPEDIRREFRERGSRVASSSAAE